MLKILKSLIKKEEGQALILVALSLAIFIGVAAIVVDYGYLAWQRRQLQNAADAGALAAAMELPNGTQTTVNEYASNYANDIVSDSFKIAVISADKREVEVQVEKTYGRFFGTDQTILGANATALRYNYWFDSLLPLGLRDDYNGEQNHLDLDGYITFLEDDYIGETINLWGKDDEDNLKFGDIRLGPFSPNYDKPNKPIDKVIEDGVDRSIYGHSIETESGVSASKKTFQDRFDEYGNNGYIIGVLPSRASQLTNSETTVPWEEYVILYFTDLTINDKGKTRLEGKLAAVYDITSADFSDQDILNSDLSVKERSKLIK